MTTRQMERAREQRKVELQRYQFKQKYLRTVKISMTPSKTTINIEVCPNIDRLWPLKLLIVDLTSLWMLS